MAEISIVLPVKNGERFICEAINSVLNQTFSNFELLIFNDRSSDATLALIRGFDDKRIKVFDQPDGFICNLNLGLELASSEFVARMDADDIMEPNRLELQYKVMTENPDIDLCATWINLFGEQIMPCVHEGYNGYIHAPFISLLDGNIFPHPSVILRKKFLRKYSLSYTNCQFAEDYQLWFDMAKAGAVFYVLPIPLLNYRISGNQVSQIYRELMLERTFSVQIQIIKYLISSRDDSVEKLELELLFQSLLNMVDKKHIRYDTVSSLFFEIFCNFRKSEIKAIKNTQTN